MRNTSYLIGKGDYLSGGSAGNKFYDDVITAFIKGKSKKGERFSTDGKTLYSYDTAIAKKRGSRVTINNTKYSRTTQKQVDLLDRRLKSEGIEREYTGTKDFGYNFEDFDDIETNDDKFRKHFRK